jgi:segregation and condensation protein B
MTVVSTRTREIVEMCIFLSKEPCTAEQLQKAFEGEVPIEDLKAAADELVEATRGKSVMVVEIAGGYQMRTNPAHVEYAKRFLGSGKETALSGAALETLSIIAYKQPVSQAEIEAIRGKNSTGVLVTLLEKNLIKVMGRSKDSGRAYIYGTTREFLKYFGLASLADLPPQEAFHD